MRWVTVALRAGYVLYLAARDKRAPMLARIVATACAAYVLAPINLIPDEIPVIGEMDDAVVVVLGILITRRLLPAPLLAELREKAAERFPEPPSVAVPDWMRIRRAPKRGPAFGVDPHRRERYSLREATADAPGLTDAFPVLWNYRTVPGVTGARVNVTGGLVFALATAVASRVMVYAVGYAAHLVLRDEGSIVTAFCRWDCFWYVTVMRDGYAVATPDTIWGEVNWAFFPLLPLLAHVVWTLGSISPRLALLITGNLVFLMAVPVIYCYGREQFDEAFARALVVITCFSPYSVYFSAGYSESLFLLATALALLLWRRERFLLAGFAAAAASATRILGAFLVLPLAISALLGGILPGLCKLRERELRMLIGILLAPAGLALFMTFLYLRTGDALAPIHAQIAGWDMWPGNPFRILLSAWETPDRMQIYFAVVISMGLGLALYLAIRKRFGDAAFMVVGILAPLSAMTTSMPRYIFGLLPTYVALTLLARDLRLPTLLIAGIFATLDAITVVVWVSGSVALI